MLSPPAIKDALTRQANESVRIANSSKDIEKTSMNSKSQFNHPPIARLPIERVRKTSSAGVGNFRQT